LLLKTVEPANKKVNKSKVILFIIIVFNICAGFRS
jgi:hypothetical protein